MRGGGREGGLKYVGEEETFLCCYDSVQVEVSVVEGLGMVRGMRQYKR